MHSSPTFIAVAVGSMMLTPLPIAWLLASPRAWSAGSRASSARSAVTVIMRGELPPLDDHVIIVG